jgi:hypothetical protein
MDIREAELIYEAGREAVVKTLLELYARVEFLLQQVSTLENSLPDTFFSLRSLA